ncbi:MAG TPA: hypothetical protein VLA88_02445 [Candidatus Saccharimonadales bacterium]|nr:hypothetical protein [Candidatus Saccharimonadales bacterium]
MQKGMGVGPTSTTALDPRQELFIDSYCNVSSVTFGNCYRSAIRAGYSVETAKNLTHNRPKWLSEKLGQLQVMNPELLLLKLTAIIDAPGETTQNKLRAINMMMKHYRMFGTVQTNIKIGIQSVLD